MGRSAVFRRESNPGVGRANNRSAATHLLIARRGPQAARDLAKFSPVPTAWNLVSAVRTRTPTMAGRTRGIKADGEWKVIHQELRQRNPLQKHYEECWALRNVQKETAACALLSVF